MFVREIIGAFTGQNKRDKSILAGKSLVFGLLAGSVTALLLTPKSGPETRRLIADKTNEAAGTVKDATVHAAGKVQNTAVSVGKKVKKFHRKSKAAEHEARAAARKLRHGARRVEEEEADFD